MAALCFHASWLAQHHISRLPITIKTENGAFRLNNNVSTKHKDTRAEMCTGPYGELMDAFKVLTSYDATGRPASHRVNRTKGINISLVAQHYYDWLKGKGTAREVAGDRRRADNRLFPVNKDVLWVNVQLSRVVFNDHREGLPQRSKNMLWTAPNVTACSSLTFLG
jgi:hypothetical protein